jgi:hypothetical protein
MRLNNAVGKGDVKWCTAVHFEGKLMIGQMIIGKANS